jgi:hypothetical protein
MRQRLLQGGAFQFSSVHGNSYFHDAVNIAYIVNMLKPYFPLFFDLWQVKDKRHHSTNLLATMIDLVHRRIKLRHLNDETVLIHLRGQWQDNIPLFKLACDLKKFSADQGLLRTLEAIDRKDPPQLELHRPAEAEPELSFAWALS